MNDYLVKVFKCYSSLLAIQFRHVGESQIESKSLMAQDKSNYENWDCPVVFHSSPSAFHQSPGFGDGIHRISLGISHLDILVRKRPGNSVLVVFSGAVDRTDTTPPYFSGVGLSSWLPFSLISISDPAFTVDETLRIGWYTGVRDEPIQTLIPEVIDTVLSRWKKRKAVLLGGSAGGFAALATAPQLRHSSATFAMNPQTNIENYHHKHSVKAWASVCKSEAPEQVIDLASYYKTVARQPTITYFQNNTDIHKDTHAEPFLAMLSERPTYVLGDWGEGHIPPPTEVLAAYLLPALLPKSAKTVLEKLPPALRQALIESIRKIQQ
ncbi:hypothetical protein [uncultured Corynebacterium sp.]|uniref:hypothetical protein n=1 Tax=uncultured Corynebacterium sp. TaxID=159447 RepID=UPI00288ACA32|nr:hypothetical protein [uncultured Corynebacterium sp.]